MGKAAGDELWLGLDTGGTYTDAVILKATREVVATAKALTTRQDLSIGLGGAIRAALAALPASCAAGDITLVSVSTTLATNAVVERRRSPICALLVGYDEAMLTRGGLSEALGDHPVALIRGGHRATGEEEAPLDVAAAEAAIRAHADRVEAFAVSSLFSVRNPSHEQRIRSLIRDLTGKPVTCGHELTSGLDAPRRALTAALNAQLTPKLRHLLEAVQTVLTEAGIGAPLMVVKGDGSLMAVEMALECPVETVLSGPAASVVGARFLTGRDDFVMSDMGGTTTDIAVVRNGHPVLSAKGASVGGWNTMVEAVDVRTFGLGGDSELAFDGRSIVIGPRRVVPLSLFAATRPELLDALRQYDAGDQPPHHPGRFAFRAGPAPVLHGRAETRIWDALSDGPRSFDEIAWSPIAYRALIALVDQGVVAQAGPTPSDAMHALGLQQGWNEEAARLGARLLLRGSRDWYPAPSEDEVTAFCARIREQVVRDTGRALCAAAFGHDPGLPTGSAPGPFHDAQVAAITEGRPFSQLLQVEYRLALPLVAIGAPVGGYYPQVAERLQAELVIPDHAAVTNAIGAVAGVVMQSVEILVTTPKLELYRLHGPHGNRDFRDPDEVIAAAVALSRDLATAAAHAAGALAPELATRIQRKTADKGGGGTLLIEAAIRTTASGRPVAARAMER
jgi:N-methylhydantoinase A/oxoprolinase/acetone carboxylase beta subunit